MARAKRRAVAGQVGLLVVSPTSVAKRLRDGLKNELKKLRINAAVHVEPVPGTSLRRFHVTATADLLQTARAQGHEFEILAKPVHPQDLLAKLQV